MRLRRRAIPPVIAFAVCVAVFSPLVTGWPDEGSTNEATLLLITVMFALTSALFYWMRARMDDHVRTLTRFGTALVDFFLAVVLCNFAIAVVFGAAYIAARAGHLTPFWVRVTDRAALTGGAAFVMLTGGAVAIEMRRAGTRLRVHEEERNEP